MSVRVAVRSEFFRFPRGAVNLQTRRAAISPREPGGADTLGQIFGTAARGHSVEGAIIRAYATRIGDGQAELTYENDARRMHAFTAPIRIWMNTDPTDYGPLILEPSGAPVSTARIGQTTYTLVPSTNTQTRLRLPLRLTLAASDFASALSKREARPTPQAINLLRYMSLIYRSLHINQRSGVAHFYLTFSFGKVRNHSFNAGGLSGTSIFFRVLLSRDPQVYETQILYMAMALTRQFEMFQYKYGLNDVNFDVYGCTIRQAIRQDHAYFSHVVTGHIPISKLERMIEACPDALMRNDMCRIQRHCAKNGKVLSSAGNTKNCFAGALWLAKKNRTYESLDSAEQSALWSFASDFMKSVFGAKTKNRSLKEIVCACRERCLTGHYQVNIFNYRMEHVYQIPSIVAPVYDISLLVFAQHAYAFVDATEVEVLEELEGKLIPKPISEEKDIRIGAGDLETTYDTVEAYAAAYRYEDSALFMSTGPHCMENMLDHMQRSHDKSTSMHMIEFHNGGVFDMFFMARAVYKHKQWRVSDIFEHNGRILYMDIVSAYDGSNIHIRFADSVGILPMSLAEAGRSFCIKHHKLVDQIDHRKMTERGWEREWGIHNGAAYLKEDVETLLEAIHNSRDTFREVYLSPIYGNHYTFSGASMNYWLEHHYDIDNYPLYTLSEQQHSLAKQAYFGGSCEIYYRGEVVTGDYGKYPWEAATRGCVIHKADHGVYYQEPAHVVLQLNSGWEIEDGDAKAMYPFVMIEREYPYGMARVMEFTSLPEDFFGVVFCRVRGGSKRGINILRYRTSQGVTAPYFTGWRDGCWTSIDIRNALRHADICHYEFEFFGGIAFKKAQYFKQGIQKLIDIRESHPRDSPKHKVAKMGVCSVYGGFAIKEEVNKLIIRPGDQTLAAHFSTGTLLGFNKTFAYVKTRLESKSRQVVIAASVTSYGFEHLINTVIAEAKRGHLTMMTDTDSRHGIRRVGTPFVNGGSRLGDFCPEVENIRRGIYDVKKGYAIQYVAVENGRPVLKEKIRLKGFPHHKKFRREMRGQEIHMWVDEGEDVLCYNDFKLMISGYVLVLHTHRFIGGLTAWVTPSHEPRLTVRPAARISFDCKLRGRLPGRLGWTLPLKILVHS